MAKSSRRTRVGAVALAVTAAAGTVGAVVVLVGEPATDAGPSAASARQEPVLPTEHMTLVEIAAAASAKPGEVIPPCPGEATVQRLKEAEIEFGPCDPFPEPGQVMTMPEVGQHESDEGRVVCPEIQARGLDVEVEIPCAVGAEILSTDFPTVHGQTCIQLTYIPEADAEEVTKTFCREPSDGGGAMTPAAPT